MTFKRLPPISAKDLHLGCLNCTTATIHASMDMVIAVGFGNACVTKDGKLIYDEQSAGENLWTFQDAENAAMKEPGCDWRIEMHGPLHGETFQRHGPSVWVCIESNEGFA